LRADAAEIGGSRQAILVEGTAWQLRLVVLQRLDATHPIGEEMAMEAGFGDATQPQDVAIGRPWTAQIEGFHVHRHPRIGMMKPPISQCGDFGFVQGDLHHR
jgi:hypothetical protein